jgi:hypothetical protein
MINRPTHFDLDELVCPHIFFKYGEVAWQFFDQKQLILLDWIRNKLGPMYANNWHYKYLDSDYINEIKHLISIGALIKLDYLPPSELQMFDERGLRCNLCSLNILKTNKGIIYVSPHFTGQATDYDVKGMMAEEVRKWLIKHQDEIPYPIRLEKGVGWVHQDSRDAGEKVHLVNPS